MPQEIRPHLASWLRRVNQHQQRERLLLSGSALIAALCPSARTPNDLDFVVAGEYNYDEMAQLCNEISQIADQENTLCVKAVQEIFVYGDAFPGVRVHLDTIDPTSYPDSFSIDMSFGDPLSVPPREIAIPEVGNVLAVAPETLFGWKLHALIQFGYYGWRKKDLFDLYVLWTEAPLDWYVLPEAIDIAFSSRNSQLDDLDDFRYWEGWGLEKGDFDLWGKFSDQPSTTSFRSIRDQLRAALNELLTR